MQTKNLMSYEGAAYIAEQMQLNYGEKFIKQWAKVVEINGVVDTTPLIETMRETFAGLKRSEVERGLSAMLDKTFVPSLPEFRSWCKQPSLFCEVETAYINAANEKYNDAATYEAARRTGIYELRSRAETSTKPVFKKHYEAVCVELEINPNAFRLPEAQRIEQSPAQYVKKDKAFFEKLRKGSAA
jgi:hypothetical protein